MITFEVKGKVQGKARARTFYDKRIDKMRSVTPEKTKSYEDLIRWSYKAYGGQYHGEKQIVVTIQAFYEVPKSFSKKKKEEAINEVFYPTTKPDCDNIVKVVLDALNGVAYYDDKQVINVSCSKFYAEESKLKIVLGAM